MEIVPCEEPRGALWLGTGVHYGLAQYYAHGTDPWQAASEWLELKLPREKLSLMWEQERKDLYDTITLMKSMLTGYTAFAKRWDDFEVRGVEVPLNIPIPGTDASLVSSLDLVVERSRGVWVMDHKTAALYVNPLHLEMDDQMTAYLWMLMHLMDVAPKGALYNELRKKIPAQPEPLKRGGLSKAKNVDTTYEVYLAAIHENELDPADYKDILTFLRNRDEGFYRRTAIARTKYELEHFGEQLKAEVKEMTNPDTVLYPHPTRDCSWSCSYRDLCMCENTGGDLQALIEANYEHAPAGRRQL
jgi:hypothetical protein